MDGKENSWRTASPESSFVSMKSTDSMDQPNDFSEKSVPDHLIVEKDVLIQAQSKCDSATSHTTTIDVLKERHKSNLKSRSQGLFEGYQLQKNKTFLNQIYTELYILEGVGELLNKEHEILQMEKGYKMPQETINCNDIFKPLPICDKQKKDKIKIVFTNGIAGIGKTVSIQKFILDWAEGKANRDVDFMFVLPFRELNLIKDHQYSLQGLLLDFHPELKDLNFKVLNESQVVFIFDGLDESKITLKFLDNEKINNVKKTSSVDVLMSNLIKGDLLPSALIWITSRPAAAHQIPSQYINRMTEIHGFSDPQKEDYFRKRISCDHQASRMISHIRRSRTLQIMCHIPVFCWISSTVLQKFLEEDLGAEIPQTLTEMYIQFLLIQKNIYDLRFVLSKRDVIVKLAKLAYRQLMKGNVMFYEEDLKESDIDPIDTPVCFGIYTEIFKEESVIHQRKVYCFIHLSFQEFLGAFYVFYRFVNDTSVDLKHFDLLSNFLKGVIDAALRSKNGHLDLFLRFLLGISLESNQRLLKGLLIHTEKTSESMKTITAYIKDKIKHEQGLLPDRSINLFLCLLEMKDQTLLREIQEFLKSDKHSENKLSPAHCSAIAYILRMSEEVLEELDLKKYNTCDEGRYKLVPAVINCRKALLADCSMTAQCCEIVASALQSADSPLRELDLSNNDVQDAGVKLICAGLKSQNCRLEILKLSGCMVTEEGCHHLVSALNSNPSHLKELDLSYNHPGEAGVEIISTLQKNPDLNLENINLDNCEDFRITPGLQKYACVLTLDPDTANTRLALSEGYRRVTHVDNEQPYPDCPERFMHQEQVLCRETLSDRCYWEAEWSGGAYIAVTYKGKDGGIDCKFGWNKMSWSIFCTRGRYTAWHDSRNTEILVQSDLSNRVAVYLDKPAGTLSFYSVSDSDTLTHIHTFNTTFSDSLYAGFAVYGSVLLSGRKASCY